MNIEKIDDSLYYYTDILSQEEQDLVIKTIKDDSDWTRIHDYGHVYNPDKDPDDPANQSCMIAYRKNFNELKYNEFRAVINKAFQIATKHYEKDKNIQNGRPFTEFKGGFAHVDKHLQGTTYATHIDTAPVGIESYTVLFYLNDDYIGGELSFSLPKPNKEIIVRDNVLDYGLLGGPKGTYPPDHEKNIGLIDVWIKTKPCSIIIFPPLKPYPHTAHEVREGAKYLIKGFWQVADKEADQWSNRSYNNLSYEEIKLYNRDTGRN